MSNSKDYTDSKLTPKDLKDFKIKTLKINDEEIDKPNEGFKLEEGQSTITINLSISDSKNDSEKKDS